MPSNSRTSRSNQATPLSTLVKELNKLTSTVFKRVIKVVRYSVVKFARVKNIS